MKLLQKILLVAALSTTLNAKAGIVELALLIDGSGSLGQTGWDLQIDAYKSIFDSGSFYDDFVTQGDLLVVRSWVFSTTVTELNSQWVEIANNQDASDYSETFDNLTWTGGWTNTRQALIDARNSIVSNSYDADRSVIDVSTDGNPCLPDSQGGCPMQIAGLASALAVEGIQVNLIGVGDGLNTSYFEPIISATGGFIAQVDNFGDFQAGLATKLQREIQGVPAPASAFLLILGCLVLRLSSKDRRQSV